MEPHARQQFEMLLRAAVERFCERIVQRCEGVGPALERLRTDPQGEGVWLDDFVEAFFRDSLLDNPGGACFVLQALQRRPVPDAISLKADTLGQHLQQMARHAFAALLNQKAIEALSQHAAFEA